MDVLLFLVGEAGLEPARPEWTLEPESSESANSTTRATIVLFPDSSNIIPPMIEFVNYIFQNSTKTSESKK